MPNQLKWVFGLLCGLALFGIQFYGFYRSTQSANWPSTTGRVTSSEINGTGRAARPVVDYQYRVDCNEYTSQNISWGSLTLANSGGKYPRGSTVEVFYNPANPSDAVLEQGYPLTAWLIMLMAIGICLAFGWPLFLSRSAVDSDLQSKTASVAV